MPKWRRGSSGKQTCWSKIGEIPDPLKVEKGRLKELGLMSEDNMCDLVKNADARGGGHVRVRWLQDHKGDEVRCRLVAKQLAIGKRLDGTHGVYHH